MKDASQDAEVRIVAYLMLMKCPDFGVITEVKKLLANEEVNQGNTFCGQCQIVCQFFKTNISSSRILRVDTFEQFGQIFTSVQTTRPGPDFEPATGQEVRHGCTQILTQLGNFCLL